MLKKRISRAMKMVRNVVGENEATSGRVTEALSHISRLTQLVRRQAGFGGQEEPVPVDRFEDVELGDLPGVPAPAHAER